MYMHIHALAAQQWKGDLLRFRKQHLEVTVENPTEVMEAEANAAWEADEAAPAAEAARSADEAAARARQEMGLISLIKGIVSPSTQSEQQPTKQPSNQATKQPSNQATKQPFEA